MARVTVDMDRKERVEELMERFSERTGLVGAAAPERYLWTDAFAVCNYLSLHEDGGDQVFLDRARRLVGQVHDVPGGYAENDARRGWPGRMDDRERTWIRPENRDFPAWTDHRNINDVMLATCLAPDGYLGPASDSEPQQEVSS